MFVRFLSKEGFPSIFVTFVGMDRVYLKKIPTFVWGVAVLLLTVLLTAWMFRQYTASNQAVSDHFSEKVNLALRRTAHYLLTEAGDSSSRIQPVKHPDAETWLLQLEHSFHYDRLPVLLQQSLELHGIHGNYDVAVLNCSDGELELGYNFMDFVQNSSAPCGGRAMELNCYNLQVRFVTVPATNPANRIAGWILAVGGIFTGIFLTTRRRNADATPAPEPDAATSNLVLFGHFRFDPGNQTLFSGAVQHQLTYREAKLLHLFASHPNQLLERDFILQSVWGDEGIIVGRSLDVFVSRLRKMLRDDPSVRMVAVHGVGYRLEVT